MCIIIILSKEVADLDLLNIYRHFILKGCVAERKDDLKKTHCDRRVKLMKLQVSESH